MAVNGESPYRAMKGHSIASAAQSSNRDKKVWMLHLQWKTNSDFTSLSLLVHSSEHSPIFSFALTESGAPAEHRGLCRADPPRVLPLLGGARCKGSPEEAAEALTPLY